MLGLAVLATGAVACGWIAGIEDHSFSYTAPPDSDVPSDTRAPSSPPDPCVHRLPPKRPLVDDDAVTKNQYILVVDGVDPLGGGLSGGALGYDLDGVCTCFPDPTTRNGGRASCVNRGQTACDYEGGVDNAVLEPLTRFTSLVPGGLKQALIQQDVACGRRGLVFVVAGYNGKLNDGEVTLGTIISDGLYVPHDGGERDAGCFGPDDDASAGPFPPAWKGDDLWSTLPSSVYRTGAGPIPVVLLAAYVTDGVLVLDDNHVPLPIVFAGSVVHISSPVLVAPLKGVDERGETVALGAGAAPRFLRVEGGVVAGRISGDEFLTAIGRLKINSSVNSNGYVCEDKGGLYSQVIKRKLCDGLDVMADPLADFRPGTPPNPIQCDAISIAARFSAGYTRGLGADYVASEVIPSCGPGWRDSCFGDGGAIVDAGAAPASDGGGPGPGDAARDVLADVTPDDQ